MQAGHSRPYQGYPYVNPMVTDAPSIRPETASRWVNLPRRPIGRVWRHHGLENTASSSLQSSPSLAVEEVRQTLPSKGDPEDSPVVYIDLPESSGSDVAQNVERQESLESAFVQDTIMFDPFENRRIDVAKRSEDLDSERSSMSGSSATSYQATPGSSNGGPYTIYRYPEPQVHRDRTTSPNTLEMNRFPTPCTPTASSSSTYTNPRSPRVPDFLSKETHVYGSDSNEGYPPSISGGEFPEPPPAYTERDAQGGPSSTNIEQRQPEAVVELPRTMVITPDASIPMGLPHHQRKYVTCHHCSLRVHTLVIKENGLITHIIAFIMFCIMVPLVLLVYCTDIFKHENHYCPNCNKLIGYVKPVLGTKMYYVD